MCKQLGTCLQAERAHLTPWMASALPSFSALKGQMGRKKREDARVSQNLTPYPEKAALDNVLRAKGPRERGGAELLLTTALYSLCPAVTDKDQQNSYACPWAYGNSADRTEGNALDENTPNPLLGAISVIWAS